MCQMCVDTVRRCFPGITDKLMSSLLWNATAFPFGDKQYIAKQVVRWSKRTKDITSVKDRVNFAIYQSEVETTKAMRKYRRHNEAEDGGER